MKYLAMLLLTPLLFISCDKNEPNEQINGDYIWGALLSSEKASNKINLKLIDPTPFSNYAPPGPTSPEYFNVYISDNLETFDLVQELKVGTTDFEISNLTNDKPYYFYVSSHRRGFETVYSDTIMTIPSQKIQTTDIPINLSYEIEGALFSPDQKHLTFYSPRGPNQTDGYDVLYYKNAADNTVNKISANAVGPNWSANGNTIAYITTETVGFVTYPKTLDVFDLNEKIITTLSDIDYTKYYINSPQYVSNSSLLAFMSSEGNSEIYHFDIWTIDLESGDTTKITDLEKNEFVINISYEWSADRKSIYMDGYKMNNSDYNMNIYKFDISENSLTQVMNETKWRSERPTVSPDGSKMLFVSDRSGRQELWLYDINTEEYQQLTGETPNYFDARFTNLQWISNGEVAISIQTGQHFRPVKMLIE